MTDLQFRQLYEEYCNRLVAVARLYVRELAMAEDIVADSFVRLYRAAPSLPEDVRIEAYLVTIVKNQCLNYLKSRKNHQRIEGEMNDRVDRMVDASIRTLSSLDPEQLFASEVQHLVSDAVTRMPELARRVFLESRFGGKSYQESAEQLGIPHRRVHTEMQRALTLLRLSLKDYLPAWLVVSYLNRLIN